MSQRRTRTVLLASVYLLAVVTTGCLVDELAVPNENDPATDVTMSDPEAVEALLLGAAQVWWLSHQGPIGGWSPTFATMADAQSMSWSNWGVRHMSSEPRVAFPNTPGGGENVRLSWVEQYLTLSSARDGIRLIDDGMVIEDPARTARARVAGKFVQGLAHGVLGMLFDQAFILNESVELEEDVPLVPHQEVTAEAVRNLQAVIAATEGAGWDATPAAWWNGLELSPDQLAAVAHSFVARFMAYDARTAAERATVDWPTVLGHVEQGLQPGDQFGANAAPWPLFYDMLKDLAWPGAEDGSGPWSRSDYRTIGGVRPNDLETDPDGDYAAWLAVDPASRTEYLLRTADRRICPETGCAEGAQGLDFREVGPSRFEANRGTYHFSRYGHARYAWYDFPVTSPGGALPILTGTSMALLKAEGLMWVNDCPGADAGCAAAAELINQTRVGRGGLSPAVGTDGDLWEKLYYEKGIEQFAEFGGLAWAERRGVREIPVVSGTAPKGDPPREMTLYGLVPGTPRQLPVPIGELEILLLPGYTFGGDGPDMAAPSFGRLAPASAVYRFGADWSVQEKVRYVQRLLVTGDRKIWQYH